jgi:hypothetical protein
MFVQILLKNRNMVQRNREYCRQPEEGTGNLSKRYITNRIDSLSKRLTTNRIDSLTKRLTTNRQNVKKRRKNRQSIHLQYDKIYRTDPLPKGQIKNKNKKSTGPTNKRRRI